MCGEAIQRVRTLKFVPLSKNEAMVLSNNGVLAATNDKMRLNSWLDRNEFGGFGLVPRFSKVSVVYVRSSLLKREGFSLGKAILSSHCIVFSEIVEEDAEVETGRAYLLEREIRSIEPGIIGGSFSPGVVNSGAELLHPDKVVPLPEWDYWKVDRMNKQKVVRVKWASF